MREYLEIVIYSYKKQNGLDVYSELSYDQLEDLKTDILCELNRINMIHETKNSLNKGAKNEC